jgi:nicotinate-nucleotide adenylyltransferase
MLDVVLFGGAFNPVTIAHMEKAEFVLNRLKGFDELWFLPCYASMWGKPMEPPVKRIEMLRRAVQHMNNPRIKICDFELKHKLVGHTNEIIDKLFNHHPSCSFYFLIGMDHANAIHTWGGGNELIKKLNFIVMRRGGVERNPDAKWYFQPPHIFVGGPETDISSTDARNEISKTGHTDKVIPSVMEFIKENKLYLT